MQKVGFFSSIHFKIVIIYVLLILIAMQVISVYFTRQLEDELVENHYEMLDERANLLAYNVVQEMTKSRDESTPSLRSDIDSLLREFFSIENAEVQVIDKNKVVVSTSNFQKRHIIGQRTTEIRVKRALLGMQDNHAILIDQSTGHRVRVIAVPAVSDNEIIGAIYIEASMEEIYEQMEQINQILMTGTIIALLITAILGIFLARTLTRPIMDMREQAHELGKGDYNRQVHVYGRDEIGQLAITFNELTSKLKDANATTEAEKRKLSSVLTHMTDGVIATDKNGNIILMNKQAENLLNTSQEQCLGKSIIELLGISGKLGFGSLNRLDSMLLDFSEDNNEYILQANFSVIQKSDGENNGVITVLHDVTEQEKIDRERKEFVANVSHELRTPLTSMKSYLEALSDGAMDDPNLAPKFLNVAQTETERMIRLVNALLQLSKMDSNDYTLQLAVVDITMLLNSVVDRYEFISDSKIKFVKNYREEPLFITVDKDKIIQVFDNVLSNATKYSPEGGKITVSMYEEEKVLNIHVSDEGVGIPKESLPYVFERFYRVDKARSRRLGGTGLGLAIAKQIITSHGGEISIKSKWNVGTTIIMTLPYPSEEVVNEHD